jgi:serine protease inhibitor
MKKIIILICVLLTMTGCSEESTNDITIIPHQKKPLGINTNNIETPESLMDVSLNLFKSIDASEENTLISPVSISMALAMTANGADSESIKHFNDFFGVDSIEELNNQVLDIMNGTESEEPGKTFKIANSVWYSNKQDLKVKEDFLSKTKGIYDAEISPLNFSENSKSVKTINNWVDEKTNGMIPQIIMPTDITSDTRMILINSLFFDFKWSQQYDKYQVIVNKFKVQNETNEIEFLSSQEYSYMETDKMLGVRKSYQGGRYDFIGILPENKTKLHNFIQQLNSEKIKELLNSEKNVKTNVMIPKFTCDYSISLKDALTNLGLEDEFKGDTADFGNMYDLDNTNINIYINDVIHKTKIELNEAGTKAAAVTAVTMFGNAVAIDIEKPREVKFNRPFVFMVYDKETELPVFIGSILDLNHL